MCTNPFYDAGLFLTGSTSVQGFLVLDSAGKSLGLDALIARAPSGAFAGDGIIARLYRRMA